LAALRTCLSRNVIEGIVLFGTRTDTAQDEVSKSVVDKAVDSSSRQFGMAAAEVADQDNYRAVSRWAVASLLFGLASPLALIGPFVWLLPWLGVAVAVVALRRLAEPESETIGRGAALTGLALCLVLGTAAPTRQMTFHWYLHREARDVALYWFKLLANNEPHKAYQLEQLPATRAPLDEHLWDHYRANEDDRTGLEAFVSKPVVHALLALGPAAHVHLWQREGQGTRGNRAEVVQLYAISYRQKGQRKTFFCLMTLERISDRKTGRFGWYVKDVDGGVVPPSLSG